MGEMLMVGVADGYLTEHSSCYECTSLELSQLVLQSSFPDRGVGTTPTKEPAYPDRATTLQLTPTEKPPYPDRAAISKVTPTEQPLSENLAQPSSHSENLPRPRS